MSDGFTIAPNQAVGGNYGSNPLLDSQSYLKGVGDGTAQAGAIVGENVPLSVALRNNSIHVAAQR